MQLPHSIIVEFTNSYIKVLQDTQHREADAVEHALKGLSDTTHDYLNAVRATSRDEDRAFDLQLDAFIDLIRPH